MARSLLLALCILLAATTSAWAYTGTLTAPDGLSGTGFWVADNGESGWFPASITWIVTENPNGSWRYEYELSVYRAEVSHMIVETSVGFGQEDIFDASGPFEAMLVGFFSQGGGNPYIPGQIHGVKFDDAYGTTVNFSFNSWRMPVWGDFYAKCGAVGGTQNTVWNYGVIGATGYGFTDPDYDPAAPISNGSYQYHILVPDTVVPEPSGLLALAGGLGSLGLVLKRRRK